MMLLGATAACGLVTEIPSARAQPATRSRRVAIVHPAAPVAELVVNGAQEHVSELLAELRRLGYVEAQNLTVERWSGEGQTQRYAALARDVVRTAPEVVVTFGNGLIQRFADATRAIPIVGFAADPIATGQVASLARPGGNLTGVAVDAGLELWSKRFEILKEMMPAARRVGFLVAGTPVPGYMPVVQAAAERVGLTLLDATLGAAVADEEYRRFFEALVRLGADCVAVNESVVHLTYQRVIIELAALARLPVIYPWREPVLAGGLVAYAFDLDELGRHAARQVDRILRGESPAGIPFYQSQRFALIVNTRAAAALGLTLPQSLLARADEVIE